MKKKTIIVVVLPIMVLMVAVSWAGPLNLSPRGTGLSTVTAFDETNLRIWNDANRIEALKNIVFDYNTHESAAEHAILVADAQWLKEHPDVRFDLAGYADPHGAIDYNLVLSQKRADTVKQELIQLGVSEDRIAFSIGWGELYPNCLESTEACWEQNRRVEFVRAAK